MKPDWDKLMDEFKGSATQLVADVDCTADGKPLCDEVGVRGYPTIKYGDPADLQDYQGGRDYDSLSKFAKDLKPMCSPKNIDLCDDAKKAEISKFQAMSDDELDKLIKAEEVKLEAAEEEFKAEVQKLQDKYTQLNTEKDEKIAAVKAAGLGLMKAVKASKPSGKDEL
jgi:cytochrome c556